VAIREEAEEEPIDEIFLPDNSRGLSVRAGRNPLPHFLDLLRYFLRRFHEKGETDERKLVRSNPGYAFFAARPAAEKNRYP